jgi:hypothetical protein
MLKQLDTLIGFAVVMLVVSLLITIVTQMVSSLLGLRGKNLADALQVMMNKIAPTIPPGPAQELVKEILTHPVISDSAMSMAPKWWDRIWVLKWLRRKWKVASAIRADELYDILQQMKKGEWTKAAADTGAGKDQMQPAWQATAKTVLDRLVETAAPNTIKAIEAVTGQVATLAGKDIDQAKALIQGYATATDAAFVNLEKWFNSAQDRAQQWFALHTRWITVGAAFIAAFVLQLDTIELIKRISTDSDMRSKLVAASGTIQQQADKVLNDTQRAVIDKATHKATIAELRKTYQQLPKELDDHADFASMDEAKTWLTGKLATDAQRQAILTAYERQITAAKLDAYLATMQKLVAASGLDLLPTPYPLQISPGWKGYWPHLFTTNGNWSWPKRHLLGILVSAALLSLGAPFWFNILKSLTSLRPMLAQEVDKDPKQIPQK